MRRNLKLGAVVPTTKKSEISEFLQAWKFFNGTWYVVEDNPSKTMKLRGVKHYSHREIRKDLGEHSWIIPKGSSACRSYGIYKAYVDGCDIIFSLDDDVRPLGTWFFDYHLDNLFAGLYEGNGYYNTLSGCGLYPRGYPISERKSREVYLSHGLWTDVPDTSGIDSLEGIQNFVPDVEYDVIPKNVMFPMCGMNIAFKRDLVPAMYFGLQGRDWMFDRWDDIWCGYFAKRYCDKMDWLVVSGSPLVKHSRQSDVVENIKKEATGYGYNEVYWKNMIELPLGECITATFPPDYAKKLYHAYSIWFKLLRIDVDEIQRLLR